MCLVYSSIDLNNNSRPEAGGAARMINARSRAQPNKNDSTSRKVKRRSTNAFARVSRMIQIARIRTTYTHTHIYIKYIHVYVYILTRRRRANAKRRCQREREGSQQQPNPRAKRVGSAATNEHGRRNSLRRVDLADRDVRHLCTNNNGSRSSTWLLARSHPRSDPDRRSSSESQLCYIHILIVRGAYSDPSRARARALAI